MKNKFHIQVFVLKKSDLPLYLSVYEACDDVIYFLLCSLSI